MMNKCFYCVSFYRLRRSKKKGFCIVSKDEVNRSQNKCPDFVRRKMSIKAFEVMRRKKQEDENRKI